MTFQKNKKKLVFLVHYGSSHTNLKNVEQAILQGQMNAEISAVILDNQDIGDTLEKTNPDYICLAGWKKIIADSLIEKYQNKILNIHPGLIPDSIDEVIKNPDGTLGLWNRGMYGDKAIQNVLDHKSTFAGSSIHFLTKEFDFGPVLGRTFEKIEEGDNVELLYGRLKKKENSLYVEVLEKLCQN